MTKDKTIPQMSEIHLSSSRTVTSQIYKELRWRILSMQLVPGSTMSEQETANTLGVSRTPVREAFIRLSREKLIIISPQRRTAVAKISVERAKQERFLRESLERSVLEQFVQEQSEEVLLHLEEVIALQKKAQEEEDFVAFLNYDDQFHKTFYDATGRELCYQVLMRNCYDYQRLRYLSSWSDEKIQSLNIHQHEKMLAYIKAGDNANVQTLLQSHVRRFFDEMKSLKEKYPQYIL